MNLFNRNKPSKLKRASQVGGEPAPPPQSDARAVEFAPKKSVAEDQRWLRRGLFKVGFNAGAPLLRSARKFTK